MTRRVRTVRSASSARASPLTLADRQAPFQCHAPTASSEAAGTSVRTLSCRPRTPCACPSSSPADYAHPLTHVALLCSKSSSYETLQNRTLALENLLKQHGIAVPETPASISPLFSTLKGKAALQTTSAIPIEDSDNDDGWLPALGTLELGGHGRARFVGSNAASEWTADVNRESYAVSSALLRTSAVAS